MKQAKSTEDQNRATVGHSEDVFHVFGVEGVDLNKVWSRVPGLMEEDGFSGTLLILSRDVEEGILNHEELAIRGLSAQGVQFWLFDDGVVHIQLPGLASPGDVRLVFWVIRAMQGRPEPSGMASSHPIRIRPRIGPGGGAKFITWIWMSMR